MHFQHLMFSLKLDKEDIDNTSNYFYLKIIIIMKKISERYRKSILSNQ